MLTEGTAYTEAINLLDYSVVVIPVTKADRTIDKADPDYKPLNDVDAKNWDACKSKKSLQPRAKLKSFISDDAAIYDGAPVGVQIMARRFEEEKVWAIAKIIDAILNSPSNES